MNIPKIVIVDENDEIVGYKDRGTLNQSDIYRVSALWIQNSKGDILLAQRSHSKQNSPGKWGSAVAGTIEKGESYESNIIKEAEEELGLKGYQFEKGEKVKFSGTKNFFGQWYKIVIDKKIEDFTIQEDEVEQIKWFKREKFIEELNNNPNDFVESIEYCMKLLNE